MVIVKIQKIPHKETSSEYILACFCYHFPQYTYAEAKRLPLKRIMHMLKVARQEQTKLLYNLTRAIASPHSKNGVNKLLAEFRDIFED